MLKIILKSKKVMVKKDEYALDVKFADLKDLFKEGKGDTKEFDELSREMLDYMGELTIKGIKGDFIIEKISLDLWKDRVYHLIERAGLLPEYNIVDEEEEVVDDSKWYLEDPDFVFPEMEPILTKIETN